MNRETVRKILTVYFNTRGFLFYIIYLWHPLLVGRLFYSKPMHKTYKHLNGKKFSFCYSLFGNWIEGVAQKEITLTYKDLGLYRLQLLGGWTNGKFKKWFKRGKK